MFRLLSGKLQCPRLSGGVWRRRITLVSHFFEKGLGCSGEWEADVGFGRPLSPRDAPTSVKRPALCKTTDMPTYANSPGAPDCTDTQTHMIQLKPAQTLSQRETAELNPPAQFSLASSEYMWIKKRRVNRGDSIGLCMLYWSMAACLLKPSSKHRKCTTVSPRWMQGSRVANKKTHFWNALCAPHSHAIPPGTRDGLITYITYTHTL